MIEGFWRRIYWRNHERGDQVLLAVMVADNLGNIALRTLSDLSRAAAFSGVPEDELREYVANTFEALRGGDVLFRYREFGNAMATVQVGESLYTRVTESQTVDVAADRLVESLSR